MNIANDKHTTNTRPTENWVAISDTPNNTKNSLPLRFSISVNDHVKMFK